MNLGHRISIPDQFTNSFRIRIGSDDRTIFKITPRLTFGSKYSLDLHRDLGDLDIPLGRFPVYIVYKTSGQR